MLGNLASLLYGTPTAPCWVSCHANRTRAKQFVRCRSRPDRDTSLRVAVIPWSKFGISSDGRSFDLSNHTKSLSSAFNFQKMPTSTLLRVTRTVAFVSPMFSPASSPACCAIHLKPRPRPRASAACLFLLIRRQHSFPLTTTVPFVFGTLPMLLRRVLLRLVMLRHSLPSLTKHTVPRRQRCAAHRPTLRHASAWVVTSG